MSCVYARRNTKRKSFLVTFFLQFFSLADRTCHDLTQYPVFPWVISDYESKTIDINDVKHYRDLTKPIGALNPDRLNQLLERYDEMDEPKYVIIL